MAMRKVIGKAKGDAGAQKGKALSLDELSVKLGERCTKIESSITGINKQIAAIKLKMSKISKTNPKSPALKTEKQRAHLLLKQRQMYDTQLTKLRNQQFNVDQRKFQLENMETTQETVHAMAAAKNEMKKFALDAEDVHELKTDTELLNNDLDEVNELLGETSFGQDFSDADLEAELNDLDGLDVADNTVDETDAVDQLEQSKMDALEMELLAEMEAESLPKAPANKPVSKKDKNKKEVAA